MEAGLKGLRLDVADGDQLERKRWSTQKSEAARKSPHIKEQQSAATSGHSETLHPPILSPQEVSKHCKAKVQFLAQTLTRKRLFEWKESKIKSCCFPCSPRRTQLALQDRALRLETEQQGQASQPKVHFCEQTMLSARIFRAD